jgi:hypothetical protein
VVDVEGVIKNRLRHTVRSALHGKRKACMCVKALNKIGKSGSQLFLFGLRSCSLLLLGWLSTVSTIKSCIEIRFGFMHRLGKNWSFSSSRFRRPTKALPQLSNFKASCSRGRQRFTLHIQMSVICLYQLMSEFRCQRNLNAYISKSALTCRDALW